MSDPLRHYLDNGIRLGLLHFGWSHAEDKHIWIDLHVKMPVTPERKLMFAMIEDAVKVLGLSMNVKANKEKHYRQRMVKEAWIWINQEDDYEYPISFCNCCECLGWNPSYVRRRIREKCRPIETELSKAS